MKLKNTLTTQQQQAILKSIREAENGTSGEIRIHLESRCKGDPISRAIQIFQKLKMHETALRNGAIIYIAIEDKKFAIFGDEGINKVVPENFWEDVKEEMRQKFVNDDFAEGIITGIKQVGIKLKEYFPHQSGDVNELSDEISLGE